MNNHKPSIGILTFPISDSGNIPLSNLVSIMFAITDKIYLVTGNDGYDRFKNDNKVQCCYGVRHTSGTNKIARVIKYCITQLKITYLLCKLNRDVDTWLFFIGADSLLIPMLVAKLSKKKVVFIRAGSSLESLSATQDKGFMKLASFITKVNLFLSDRIVVYSSIFIKQWNLEKYKNKITVSHRHFLDFTNFKMMSQYNCRRKTIGYVGRLSGEKGVFNLVEAMSLLSDCNFKLIIIGDGDLRSKINEYKVEHNLSEQVQLTGWIPHDKLPDYLNKLKLLVLPSYTEGLPNIMLEAMACGTPVLATAVGAIPDVIKDGETGFLLKDNSPEFIAESILKVLAMPDDKLEQVSENARRLVESEFTFENVVERWGSILDSM